MSEPNKAALARAVERFNAGDEPYFDFYTDDVKLYGLPGAPELDREGVIAFYRAFWSAFPDGKVEVLHLLAEGDLLAARFRITGTLGGEFMGVKPDEQPISVEALNVFQMEDGRCVERWIRLDEVALMSQLGLMPAPAAA